LRHLPPPRAGVSPDVFAALPRRKTRFGCCDGVDTQVASQRKNGLMTAQEDAPSSGDYWDLDEITGALKQARTRWRAGHQRHAEYGAVGFPSRGDLEKIMVALCAALFPLWLSPITSKGWSPSWASSR
jgi:hypothetical protein